MTTPLNFAFPPTICRSENEMKKVLNVLDDWTYGSEMWHELALLRFVKNPRDANGYLPLVFSQSSWRIIRWLNEWRLVQWFNQKVFGKPTDESIAYYGLNFFNQIRSNATLKPHLTGYSSVIKKFYDFARANKVKAEVADSLNTLYKKTLKKEVVEDLKNTIDVNISQNYLEPLDERVRVVRDECQSKKEKSREERRQSDKRASLMLEQLNPIRLQNEKNFEQMKEEIEDSYRRLYNKTEKENFDEINKIRTAYRQKQLKARRLQARLKNAEIQLKRLDSLPSPAFTNKGQVIDTWIRCQNGLLVTSMQKLKDVPFFKAYHAFERTSDPISLSFECKIEELNEELKQISNQDQNTLFNWYLNEELVMYDILNPAPDNEGLITDDTHAVVTGVTREKEEWTRAREIFIENLTYNKPSLKELKDKKTAFIYKEYDYYFKLKRTDQNLNIYNPNLKYEIDLTRFSTAAIEVFLEFLEKPTALNYIEDKSLLVEIYLLADYLCFDAQKQIHSLANLSDYISNHLDYLVEQEFLEKKSQEAALYELKTGSHAFWDKLDIFDRFSEDALVLNEITHSSDASRLYYQAKFADLENLDIVREKRDSLIKEEMNGLKKQISRKWLKVFRKLATNLVDEHPILSSNYLELKHKDEFFHFLSQRHFVAKGLKEEHKKIWLSKLRLADEETQWKILEEQERQVAYDTSLSNEEQHASSWLNSALCSLKNIALSKGKDISHLVQRSDLIEYFSKRQIIYFCLHSYDKHMEYQESQKIQNKYNNLELVKEEYPEINYNDSLLTADDSEIENNDFIFFKKIQNFEILNKDLKDFSSDEIIDLYNLFLDLYDSAQKLPEQSEDEREKTLQEFPELKYLSFQKTKSLEKDQIVEANKTSLFELTLEKITADLTLQEAIELLKVDLPQEDLLIRFALATITRNFKDLRNFSYESITPYHMLFLLKQNKLNVESEYQIVKIIKDWNAFQTKKILENNPEAFVGLEQPNACYLKIENEQIIDSIRYEHLNDIEYSKLKKSGLVGKMTIANWDIIRQHNTGRGKRPFKFFVSGDHNKCNGCWRITKQDFIENKKGWIKNNLPILQLFSGHNNTYTAKKATISLNLSNDFIENTSVCLKIDLGEITDFNLDQYKVYLEFDGDYNVETKVAKTAEMMYVKFNRTDIETILIDEPFIDLIFQIKKKQ